MNVSSQLTGSKDADINHRENKLKLEFSEPDIRQTDRIMICCTEIPK